jgi:hypothetical protein
MRRHRVLVVVGLTLIAAPIGVIAWVLKASLVNHWLAVHTGTVNEPGPYYAFWSGFGSDLAEFAIIGTIATGVYQVVKKYNCHEPGCWRVGNHAAAGGQFYLCYRHHPDYRGKKPNAELIARLHREHIARQEAIHAKLNEVHQRITTQSGQHGSEPVATDLQPSQTSDGGAADQ